jgi:hypothetical protein
MPRVFICFDDEPPRPDDSDCPNNAAHEPFPKGYLSASAYAEKLMDAGYTQDGPCPGCGLWKIWTSPHADHQVEVTA